MNDLLELTVGGNDHAAGCGLAGETKREFSLGVLRKKKRKVGRGEKEGKVDSLCPSCHGIAIPELPGVLQLREQLFTR